MTIHRAIRVHGLVQGVSFRVTARAEARRLGLAGFARNEPDGSVRIEVEGEAAAVERFLAWCRHGPPGARVDRLDIEASEPRGYPAFTVG